ncbi:hypothetical protein BDN71DRAFT_1544061, partial [Pleurotus eryngii]
REICITINPSGKGLSLLAYQPQLVCPYNCGTYSAAGGITSFKFKQAFQLSVALRRNVNRRRNITTLRRNVDSNASILGIIFLPTNIVRIGAGDEDIKQVAFSSDSGSSWCAFYPSANMSLGSKCLYYWAIHYGALDGVYGGKVAFSADADTILWRTDGNGVLVSRNQAAFTAVTSLPSDAAIASDKKNNSIFYGASGSVFYISSNNGATPG